MVAAIVLTGLVLTAGLGGLFPVGGALVLAAVSLLWLVVNGPMEGPVLVTVTGGHGVTGADLAGFAGLGLAAGRAFAARRLRSRT
jgi:hypothetical protein